jgi:hypothetical protein
VSLYIFCIVSHPHLGRKGDVSHIDAMMADNERLGCMTLDAACALTLRHNVSRRVVCT